MIHYVIQIIAFHFLFFAVYELFLKKETFFNWNRAYLLIVPIIALVLPFLGIEYLQQIVTEEYLLKLPAVLIGPGVSESVVVENPNWFVSLTSIWMLGMFFSALLFSWKIFKILTLKYTVENINPSGLNPKILPETDAAFSFFNSIYLGENISEENKISIIAHEKIHIEQKHSYDLLYYEILRIVFWFNPLIYLFQNRITTLHEYIADAEVIAKTNKKEYYQDLLSQLFKTENISFINTFFNQSLIKKRIIMLQKSRSTKTAQLKYLLLLPLICGMLLYTSCANEVKEDESTTISESDTEIAPKPGDEDELPVPFAVIEKVPMYPGCSGDNETLKKCLSSNISKFVNENFNIGLAENLNLSGRQRISVQFKIDKTGSVVNVRARAPHPELEKEAVRIIESLPQMEAGEQKGKKVGVLYSLPIVFDVQ